MEQGAGGWIFKLRDMRQSNLILILFWWIQFDMTVPLGDPHLPLA